MSDLVLDKGTQTLLTVFPHLITKEEESKLRVRGNIAIQTEAHFDIEESTEEVSEALKYTPFSDIKRHALSVKDIPKKFILTFRDTIHEESLGHFDDSSIANDGSPLNIAQTKAKSALKQAKKQKLKEMSRDENTQTDLMVRPYILELDEVAQVYCNNEVQTSTTFKPGASLEKTAKDLKRYYAHRRGSAVSSGNQSQQSAISSIKVKVQAQETEEKVNEEDIAMEKLDEDDIDDNMEEERQVTLYDDPESIHSATESYTGDPDADPDPDPVPDPDPDPEPTLAPIEENPTMKPKNILEMLTADDIKKICKDCCTEEEVLKRIRIWYHQIEDLLQEDSEGNDKDMDEDDNPDGFNEANVAEIEAQIISTVDETVNSLNSQLDRMVTLFGKPETQDHEVQNTEAFADHMEGSVCKGGKFRDKSCDCDCHLLEGVPGADYKKPCGVPQLETVATIDGTHQAANVGRGAASSPAFITCQCDQPSSDLPNNGADNKTRLPLDARACTNRQCHCIMSEGCRHCEQALRMQEQAQQRKVSKTKAYGKSCPSQNIECLADVDGEYVDGYLELLEQDDTATQTEYNDVYFGQPVAPKPPPPPCSCLNNVEIPWDLILVPPTPKKREEPTIEEVIAEAIPETIRAQLKELTVGPMTDDQLFDLTKEFLEDNTVTAETMDDIRQQIIAEKERIDAAIAKGLAAAEKTEKVEEEEEEKDDKPKEIRCRPRPALKHFQVFNPECERFNEPYMDRMYKYICDDEEPDPQECTSHIEMPWNEIELPKTIRIRKGRNPCLQSHTTKGMMDPNRKCGPEYRERMKREREMFATDNLVSGKPNPCATRISVPNLNSSMIRCLCTPTNSTSQPQIPLRKGVSEICVCAKSVNKITTEPCPSSTMNSTDGSDKPCIGLPAMSKSSKTCGSGSIGGRTAASRTERIAALLDSCKKEMEPIKDGINQLRSRIKELNLPDLINYQETPQHPGASATGLNLMGSMMGNDMYGMQMPPPMCYPPPMMCYPYPPCMYPPTQPQVSRMPPPGIMSGNMPGGMLPAMSSGGMPGGGMQPTKVPNSSSSKKVCKCRTKHTKKHLPTSSSYNTSSEGSESPSTDYQEHSHRRHHKSSSKTSPDKMACSCHKCKSKVPLPAEASSSKPSFTRVMPPTPSSKLICACAPKQLPSTNSQASSCLCASMTPSSISKRCNKPSKIPRRVSQVSEKQSGIVCPCPSLASQNSTRSCLSNRSAKDHQPLLSSNDSSVVIVKSCATQMTSCSNKTASAASDQCDSGPRVSKTVVKCVLKVDTMSNESATSPITSQKSPVSPKSPRSPTSPTSACRIRFSDTAPNKTIKCNKCSSFKFKPATACAAAEVKDGRPADSADSDASQ